jgi:hypothetical protein
MTPEAHALIAEFEAAGKAAQTAEAELRKKLTEEMARLERQRAFAFRRTRLIRTLATAAHGADAEEAAFAAQARSLSEDLGWTSAGAAQKEILERMRPLGRAVWQCGCGADGASPASVAEELDRFEQWFEGSRGKPLYSLFDRYVPEVPVVDF